MAGDEYVAIRIDGTAYDRDGKVLGTMNYNQIISTKVDTVTLDKLMAEVQAGVK